MLQELQSVFGLTDAVSAGVLDLSVSFASQPKSCKGCCRCLTLVPRPFVAGQQAAEGVLCSSTYGHHTQPWGHPSDSLTRSLPAHIVSHHVSRSISHCHCRHRAQLPYGAVGCQDCNPILERVQAAALRRCSHAANTKRPSACSNECSCARQHPCAASHYHLGLKQPCTDPSRVSQNPSWGAQKLPVPESRWKRVDHQWQRPCVLLVTHVIVCMPCNITNS